MSAKNFHIILISGFFLIVVYGCKEKGNNPKKHSQISNCDYVKDYFPKIYDADIAFEKEDFNKAYNLYHTAFKNCQPLNMIGFDEMEKYAKASASVGAYQSTYKVARELVKIGIETDFFEKWHVFQGFLNSKYGQRFYDEYVNLKQDYKKQVNLDLREQILYMIAIDKKYNKTDIEKRKRDSVNLKNAYRLKDIFKKYGYPNTRLVGVYEVSHDYTNISTMMSHIPDSLKISYFIPELRTLVKNGQAPPRILGDMVDQYRIGKGQGQRYGTYIRNDGTFYRLYHDLEQVDKDRRAIGMPTIAQEEMRKQFIRQR